MLKKSEMKIFFYICSEENLIKFETYKKDCLKTNKESKLIQIVSSLSTKILEKEKIDKVLSLHPELFVKKSLDWKMEYSIAKEIIRLEEASLTTEYSFELINYIFSFLLNHPLLENLFFLMHGIPINENLPFTFNKGRKYTVFKRGQELCDYFLFYRKDLDNNVKYILDEMYSNFFMEERTFDDDIYIFQVYNKM